MSDNEKDVIIVTGATGGIGSAIVELLAPTAVVIAVGKTSHSLKDLQERIKHKGLQCIPCVADLEKPTGARIISRKARSTGTVTWIVHSAGFVSTEESFMMKPAILLKTFAVNVFSFIEVLGPLLPALKKGVIAISSTAALWGNPRYPIYGASKAALNIAMQSLARQFGNDGRRAIAICPGPTNTKMRGRIAGDAAKQQSPEIVAALVRDIIFKNIHDNGDILVIRDGVSTLHERLS